VRGAPDRDEIEGVQVRRFHYFWPRFLERLADGAILENVRRSRWLLLLAPLLFLFELIAAYKWARETRPAVIHAHWFIPQGIVAVLVGRLLGIPVVVTAHGGDITGLRGWPWSVVRKVVAARSRAITVVSSDLQRRLDGVTSGGGRPPLVMPMGVDTKRFRADPRSRLPSEKTVLFVGRLAEKKGLEYLVRAFPEVLSRHPDARLIVVGDGPLRGELEALARELRLEERVQMVGGKPPSELPRFYSACRIFVGPSVVARSGDTEAFGLVFAEAMAAGRPVVATSVGGVADIVIHGRTGLLVEPESPAALARAINELLDSQAAAEKMGEVARRWVRRKFDWRNVAAGYASLLTEVARC
jgi:glycosyltransferase involved in cell wall biosynthesis